MAKRLSFIIPGASIALAGFIGAKGKKTEPCESVGGHSQLRVQSFQKENIFRLCMPKVFAQSCTTIRDAHKVATEKLHMNIDWDEENIFFKDNYVLGYNRKFRLASWVFEHLEKAKYASEMRKLYTNYVADQSMNQCYVGTEKDYAVASKRGYTKLHLAASMNNKQTVLQYDEANLFSNLAPQRSEVHKLHWEKVNQRAKYLANKEKYSNVYVLNGPMYEALLKDYGRLYQQYEVFGCNKVACPSHYFKIVVAEEAESGEYHLWAFKVPNRGHKFESVEQYLVNIDDIERGSGLVLFDPMPEFASINVKPVE